MLQRSYQKEEKMGRNVTTKAPTFTFPLTKLAMSSLLSKTDKVWRRFCSSQSQCSFISSNVAPGLEQKNIEIKRQMNSQNRNSFSKYHESHVYGIKISRVLTCWTTADKEDTCPWTHSLPDPGPGVCEHLSHWRTDGPADQSGLLLGGHPASLTRGIPTTARRWQKYL